MKSKVILIAVLVMFSSSLFAKEEKIEWIGAKATINKIEKKRSGRKTKEIATISFKTKSGQNTVTVVELMRVPFLGSFKSVGDKISINYSKKNPALAKTLMGNFIDKYGMYVLIILGVVFSVMSFMKARKQRA